jgi:hypothetical protein
MKGFCPSAAHRHGTHELIRYCTVCHETEGKLESVMATHLANNISISSDPLGKLTETMAYRKHITSHSKTEKLVVDQVGSRDMGF